MDNRLLVIIKHSAANSFNERSIAGGSTRSHLIAGLASLPYLDEEAFVPSLDYKYVALVYDDMPLITEDYLLLLLANMQKRGDRLIEFGKARLMSILDFMENPQGMENVAYTVNATECLQIKDYTTLCLAERRLYERIACKHLRNGVYVKSPELCMIDLDVVIEKEAIIEPMTRILGNSRIKRGVTIGSFSTVMDSVIEEDTVVLSSTISNAVIGKGCSIGPYAVIHKNSIVKDGARVGDFVEIKNSTLDSGVKCAHLTYVGDAIVGAKTNIGCGTVFANYDGKAKHRTIVGNRVFIGCNANLIAPLNIGDDVFIAGGATVTHDLPDGTFTISRAPQKIKPRRMD